MEDFEYHVSPEFFINGVVAHSTTAVVPATHPQHETHKK